MDAREENSDEEKTAPVHRAIPALQALLLGDSTRKLAIYNGKAVTAVKQPRSAKTPPPLRCLCALHEPRVPRPR